MAVIYGTAKWAFINNPNTKFEPCWTIDLAPDEPSDLEYFRNKGFRIKKDSTDGLEYIVIKRKVKKANGESNAQPRLVDANKNPIDVQVGNGSKVGVKYTEYSGEGKFGKYQGLDLMAVQVVDLVEYDEGGDFDTFDPDSEF